MRGVICAIVFLVLFHASRASSQMDLHAHLDLKPAMGPLLRGNFSVPPLSLEWDTKFATKGSSQSLTEFDSPPLIVVAFYGHPYFSITEGEGSSWDRLMHFDGRQNVRRALEAEYQHLLEFVAAHPLFAIARSPVEAENLLADKRIPLVLSIEGAYGGLETEADLKTWIDERGVAIVTPFHLTGDQYGGVALMSGAYSLATSPISFFRSLLLTAGSCISTFCRSPSGLSNDGRELIQRLMKHHAWIDLAHANDLEVGELLPLFARQKLPVLVTHTSPRDIYPAERGLSVELMNAVIDHDGMVGLLPTDDMIKESWKPERCFSSLSEFRETVKEMIRRLGPERIALASDINAPISGLSPACRLEPGQPMQELEARGFYTYSQWNGLGQYVSPDPRWHEKSLRHFIELWKKVRAL